jgi:2-polyprenyl-3-methyl-5-hydroxy-6-metoxy-1,4-benzoquinol methylase
MTFDYDAIPVGYYDHVYATRRGIQSKWHHLKFDRFRERMKGFHRHLDVGCGAGTFIGTLPADEHTSLGIDIAQSQIDYANRQYGGSNRRFEVVEAGPLPFPEAAFDVVTTIELIEHLTEEISVSLLRDCLRVLRPGGLLLVSTPNYGSAWPLVETAVNKLGKVDYAQQHITHFNRSRVRATMEQAGASEISVRGYMLIAPFAAAVSWALSDAIDRLEPASVVDHCGLLLFAAGLKR